MLLAYAREERTSYDGGQQPSDSVGVVSLDGRSRDQYPEGNKTSTDHVITAFFPGLQSHEDSQNIFNCVQGRLRHKAEAMAQSLGGH